MVSEVLAVAVVPSGKPGNELESEGENEPSGNCYRVEKKIKVKNMWLVSIVMEREQRMENPIPLVRPVKDRGK